MKTLIPVIFIQDLFFSILTYCIIHINDPNLISTNQSHMTLTIYPANPAILKYSIDLSIEYLQA